jgi:hypothetical protein
VKKDTVVGGSNRSSIPGRACALLPLADQSEERRVLDLLAAVQEGDKYTTVPPIQVLTVNLVQNG